MSCIRRPAGQAVVLVDEYDKPVLDVLEDGEQASANRDSLREIYSLLKSSEGHIRFVFVAGITMFSKSGFSSGLNNLDDISLHPPLAAICGYTDHDLDTVFARNSTGSTGTGFVNGITATTGLAGRISTTLTTSFVSSRIANFDLTGSKPDGRATFIGC